MKPIHVHDCDHCTYIKTIDQKDFYICVSDKTEEYDDILAGSLIARWGNEGPEYRSVPLTDYLTLLNRV